jgi:capsular exopolysaccharide synthesis family protein
VKDTTPSKIDLVPSPSTLQQASLSNQTLLDNRIFAGFGRDVRAEPFRQLRTQILKSMDSRGWRTLAITSAHEGAGKTLTAVNLAVAMASVPNHSVVLVDLDLKEPAVHRTLGLKPEYGLIDFLTGQTSLAEVLIDIQNLRLSVIPGRKTDDYASDVLASSKMKDLTKPFSSPNNSRIVIFDLPPLLRNDDALLFTPESDATLVIVEDGVTTQEQLSRAFQLLDDANVIGTVLNKTR